MTSKKQNKPPEGIREATRTAREEGRAVAERKRSATRESRARRRKERSKRWDLRTDALTLKLRSPEKSARRRSTADARKRARARSGRPALLARASLFLAPLGRLLAPVGRLAAAALSRVAPYVSQTLMFVIRVPAALIAIGLDLVLDAGGWVHSKVGPLSAGLFDLAMRTVTPVRTLVVVCSGAAIALAASQFVDYRGIAVGAPAYEGEIQTVAAAPFTDLKPAGSAHAYAMVPLAAIAVILAVMTARGRWRLGRAIGLIGLAGIVIGLAIDMPRGLDAGDSGVSYLGTEARLIEGFWAQMAASVTLLVAGPMLGLYAKRAARSESRSERVTARKRRRRASTRRRPSAAGRPSGASA